MNTRKIDKNRYIELFEKKLDKNSLDSFIEQFEYIDNLILPFIGDDDFKEKQAEAIVNFYFYFHETYGENHELLEHMFKWIATVYPGILLIAESFMAEELERMGKPIEGLKDIKIKPYNYFINIFKKNLENTKEGIVARFSYINALVVNIIGDNDIEDSPMLDEYRDAIIFFYYWFKIKYFDDVLDALKINYTETDSILIFNLAEAMIGGEFDPEELQEARYQDMLKKSYGKLTFTQKKNIETLSNYICEIKTDKNILFLEAGAEYAPLLNIPSNITDEDLAEIKKNLRGELSIMINNEEAMIFSYYDEENDKTIFNGFICEDETIRDMEEDFLEGIVIDSGIIGDVYELYDDYDDDYDDEDLDEDDVDEDDLEDDLDLNYSCEESGLTFL